MEVNLEWLGGFFDGEGSIGVYQRNKDRSGQFRYYVLVVSLAQSGEFGKQILESLQKEYGGSIYEAKSKGKRMFKWNISADKAAKFLYVLLPHLYLKADEASNAVEFQGLPNKKEDNPIAILLANRIKQRKKEY